MKHKLKILFLLLLCLISTKESMAFRPGGFAIRRSPSIRIYNPPYSYPLYRSRIANPYTQNNRITNPIGRIGRNDTIHNPISNQEK